MAISIDLSNLSIPSTGVTGPNAGPTFSFEINNNPSVHKVNPTFTLRGIDGRNVTERYLKGEFQNLALPQEKKVKIQQAVSTERQGGNTPEYEIYTCSKHIGSVSYRVTTNHLSYDFFKKGQVRKGGVCHWCKSRFEHESVGIPVFMETMNNKKIFHVDGMHCSYECAYSLLKKETECSLQFQNWNYRTSEQMLKIMFYTVYPNEDELFSADDWRLLEENGGPLSRQEWSRKSHFHIEIPSIVLVPLKFIQERISR